MIINQNKEQEAKEELKRRAKQLEMQKKSAGSGDATKRVIAAKGLGKMDRTSPVLIE